jgi:kynurenine formamidase
MVSGESPRRLLMLPGPVRVALVALALLAVVGCTTGGGPAVPQVTLARRIDLSHVVREDVPYLPGESHTRIERDAAGDARQLQIGMQTGTLLQIVAAPNSDLRTLDLLSPDDLVLPAVVIDVRDHAQDSVGYRLSAADLSTWERRYGRVPRGALVLLVTGWDLRWGDPAAYLDPQGGGLAAAPAFGAEAAAILLDERGAIGLAIDAPGTTYLPASGYRLLLENLTSLEQLPPTGATVVIGALKLQAAQRSPARVIALVP